MARSPLVMMVVLSLGLAACGGVEGDGLDGDADAMDQALTRYTFTCYGRGRQKGQRGELKVSGTRATFKDLVKDKPACAFGQSVSPPIPCSWTMMHGAYDPTYNPRSPSRQKMARFLDHTETHDQPADGSNTRELFIEKVLRTGGRDVGDGSGGDLIFAPTRDANAGFDGGSWSFFCKR